MMANEGTTVDEGANPAADAAALAAAAAAGNQADPAKVTQQNADAAAKAAEGSAPKAAADDPFAELETDTREWLSKREIKDARAAAKLAHEQAKLLGNAIRIPSKDATPEEVQAYREKLGVPKTVDEYDFKVPADLPKDLPYDGERATAFKSFALDIGLSKAQAQQVHDWATKNAVGDFHTALQAQANRTIETAKSETEKLVKMWGPLNGETARANLSFADKALEHGGAEARAEFARAGLIGTDKTILSAPLAKMLADFGRALYQEDNVLRGSADRLNNPFADGNSFNLTASMKMIKENPELADSYITAAGKKRSDFGLI